MCAHPYPNIVIMRYHLNFQEPSHYVEHEYYPGGFTWQLWQIIWFILGLLLLCFLIGICINCFRRSGFVPGGVYGAQPGVYI